MRIKSIEIQGFRNIEKVKLSLDKMAVLVSENSYGKSNVMTAIDFAVAFIKAPDINKEKMMGYIGGIPLNLAIDRLNFRCEIAFEDKLMEDTASCVYGYEFIWEKDDGSGSRIIAEWLDVKVNGLKQKAKKLILRGEKACYKASETGRCSSVLNVGDNELMINRLFFNEKLFYYPIVEAINNLKVYVERHLDASDNFDFNPIIKREAAKSVAIEDVDNIPRTIYLLKQNYKAKYELLIDAFRQLFPNIKDIIVREFDIGKKFKITGEGPAPFTIANKVYALYVVDENMNQLLDFKWLSDGAKRIFLMLTYAIVAEINGISLLAFEEPENSIHPALLQNYLDVLLQFSADCSILCTSHSPYILQYVDTKDIYIGKPNRKRLAEFAKIDSKKISSLYADAADSDHSVGNYIFELLSGGEDDLAILCEYLEN